MKNVLLYTAICLTTSAMAQQTIEPDSIVPSPKPIQLDEVLVSSVRATKKLPVTFSNLSKEEIKTKNFGQQLPLLLGQLPNVVSYSEDGSGFGSSNMFVRGSDLYRTNVTINGVPLNDSESQGVFWYNLSDFASSAESIQLQRGVGTSSNEQELLAQASTSSPMLYKSRHQENSLTSTAVIILINTALNFPPENSTTVLSSADAFL